MSKTGKNKGVVIPPIPPPLQTRVGFVPVVLLLGMTAGALMGKQVAESWEELVEYIMIDDDDEKTVCDTWFDEVEMLNY